MSINNKKEKDIQSRSWQITLNNPEDKGFNRETFKEALLTLNPIYCVISEEVGLKEKTPHYHAYIKLADNNPQRFSRISKLFNKQAHIEKALGSAIDNRNYILKTGKWEETDKNETLIDYEEIGEIPISVKEKHKREKEKLLEDIKAGKTNMEIIEENPSLAFRIREMDLLRSNYLAEKYGKEFRNIKTYFFYGNTATGKSTYVYDNWSAKDIFRIYNYDNLNALWSGYNSERIIFMDEFDDTKVPLNMMLILLDKFPLSSGIMNRYQNVTRCFDTIICASNRSYENIYSVDRVMRTSSWKALDRRFGNVWEFTKNSNNEYNIIKHRETKYEEENKYE